MRSHVIDIGPNSVRRLCCGGATVADPEMEHTAFECIDDSVALIDSRPVTVASLWRHMLEAIHCGAAAELTVIHPSWWSSSRLNVVAAAMPEAAELRPRSWLLGNAAPSGAWIVEITADFLVVTRGEEIVVVTRRHGHREVEKAVGRVVSTTAADAVVIDAPAAVQGAGALARAIAKSVPVTAIVVDDLRFRRLAGELKSRPERTGRRTPWPLAALVLLAALPVGAWLQHAEPPAAPRFPTTFAVEGHVTVEVPAEWAMQRIIAGPGSARLQFTSPGDSEVALHVTQSRVALPGLDATADFLRRAIDEAPDGAFVDFNPADHGGGRPVVTYREVRPSHDIHWTVWVDKAVRISIGCQTRGGHPEAIGEVCELAVRSARALD